MFLWHNARPLNYIKIPLGFIWPYLDPCHPIHLNYQIKHHLFLSCGNKTWKMKTIMDGNRPSFVKPNESNNSAMLLVLLTFHTRPLRKVMHFCQKLVFRAVSTHPFRLSISLIALTAFSERPKMVPVIICLHPISFSIDRLCVSYSLGRRCRPLSC